MSKVTKFLELSAAKITALLVVLIFLMPASLAISVPLNQEIEGLSDEIEKKKDESEIVRVTMSELKDALDAIIEEYQLEYGKLQQIDNEVTKKQRELNSVVEQQLYYQGLLDELNVFTYRDGDIHFFEVVLGTRSFKDLIVRLEYLVKLNERQADILHSTKRLHRMVKDARDGLYEEKTHQRELVVVVQEKQEAISGLLAQQQELIASLDDDIVDLKTEKEEKQVYREKLEADAAAAAEAASRTGQTVDLANVSINLAFPIPRAYASSFIDDWGFARAGNPSGHQGTDIFAIKGTPLIAVTDGVIGSEFGDSRVGGYRLHIIDDQGIDYYYAHLNNDSPGTDDGLGGSETAFAPGIAPGARVRKGQVVGFVGDSGDAEPTPPHLHFGIQAGDTWIPAFSYLKAASYL